MSSSIAVLLAPAWTQQMASPIAIPAKAATTAPASRPASSGPSLEQKARPYVDILKTHGVEATTDGLRKYLRGLRPTEAQKNRLKELIRQLGSRRWGERDSATRELMATPFLPLAELREAATCGDPEAEVRAQTVLAKREGHVSTTALHAVFQVVRLKKLTGLTQEILSAMGLCDRDRLVTAAVRAVVAGSRKQDVGLLRAALKESDPRLRRAGATGLAAVLKAAAARELRPFLTDKDPRVSLLTAIQLAELGDRRSLGALHRLMGDQDASVRHDAYVALASLTGNCKLAFHAFADARKRSGQHDAWKTWLAANGAKVTLRIPFREHLWERSYLDGHTLVAYGHRNRVEELDGQGKVVWSHSAAHIWHAEKLSNGNVLICVLGGPKVQEVNRDGKTVWEYSAFAMDARQLPNGNVLIADFKRSRVIEVTRDKEIVWQQKTGGDVYGVQRLADGNTLVACQNGTTELTRDGEVVWEYAGCTYSAQRLPNGNTLMPMFKQNRVLEVSPDKKTVWEFSQREPCEAYRLPNGNTLIATTEWAIEVTPDKKIIWQRAGLKYGSVRK
ncbi:MAG: HEAT repeat domain-containing protein [Planctomycetota bacterium]